MRKNRRYYKEFKHNGEGGGSRASEGGKMENPGAEPMGETEDIEPKEVVVDGDYAGEAEDTQAEAEVNTLENQLADLQAQVEKEKKEYMFLMAEFDNFRKRTLREKSEIIKNAGENVLRGLLPILDDFERGIAASEKSDDAAASLEGMKLIYQKFVKYLEANGVKEMESNGAEFNPDLHEAIAQVPAQSDDQKGKVIDTVQKGYMINDKVLRHAKVAVAQ